MPSDHLVGRAVRSWLPRALLALLLLALAQAAGRTITNADTYFHLRFGRELLGGWRLTDPGSVSSFATADWVPTQWLPQVLMATVEQQWGLAGVVWLSGAQAVAFAVALYGACRQRSGALPAVTLTVVAVIACWPYLSMRPQVLSYLFTALTVTLWFRARSGTPPWLVVPLTWLWAMCHGMWPVAISIGVVAVVAGLLDRSLDPRAARRQGLAVLACGAAAAATPVGPRLYGAVWGVGERSRYFLEWGPPDFTSPSGIALLAIVVPALLAASRLPRVTWWDLLVLCLGLAWALYSARTVPVAAAIAAPAAAGILQAVVGRREPRTRAELATVLGGAAVALAGLALLAPGSAGPRQPSWVDPALSRLPGGTPVLNDWNVGGYVMWRYPHLDLVMHGYGDTFTLEELERNRAITDVEPGWDDLVRATGARHALVPTDSPLAYALEHQTGWRVVHRSARVELLEAPAGWPAPAE